MILNDSNRHTKLDSQPWSSETALNTIRDIFSRTNNKLQPDGFWQSHPDEDSHLNFNKTLYLGATGTLWGLIEIAQYLKEELPWNPVTLAEKIHLAYLEEPDTREITPAYLAGETGILLLQYKLTKSQIIKEKLCQLIESNFTSPHNEILFGSPGTMLASLYIDQPHLFVTGANSLFETWYQYSEDLWVWDQEFGRGKVQYVGAAHGFAGNAHVLLKGRHLLSKTQNEILLERVGKTIIKSSVRSSNQANWKTYFNTEESPYLTQWCHGAPGIITSLHSFPKNYSAELEKVLAEAGELIWASGPLKKGIGICHGTDGNGYAFLDLYHRTGNELWLERARAFAMISISQVNGRSSLWTGEIGLALYLISCIERKAGFPCLDYF